MLFKKQKRIEYLEKSIAELEKSIAELEKQLTEKEDILTRMNRVMRFTDYRSRFVNKKVLSSTKFCVGDSVRVIWCGAPLFPKSGTVGTITSVNKSTYFLENSYTVKIGNQFEIYFEYMLELVSVGNIDNDKEGE